MIGVFSVTVILRMKQLFTKQFNITVVITIILSLVGFLLLSKRLEEFGYTTFIITPVCIGYFIGQRPGRKINLVFALLFGIIAFFVFLFTMGLEFLFCIILVSPIIIVGMYIGTAIGYWLRQKVNGARKSNNLKLSILPLLVLLFAGTFEHYFMGKYDYLKVQTSIYLPYGAGKVYDYIKSVDTLNTDKPFLLHLGLPIPEKCILSKEAVGAERTCYFEEGKIDERVTALKRGEYLKMNVTGYTVPLPKWLTFNEAIYLFKAKDTGTVLTRITTYRTELKPRFYWRFWEVKAIEAEHEYVLEDLKRRLKER